LVQAVVPSMKKEKFGRIINIISTSVKIPIRGLGVSNTIRGAVANWSKTLSLELGPFGITVNNVLPGATMTGRLESIINTNAQKNDKTFDEAKQDMIKEIPAGRISDASEVAAAVAFLASPAAGYINGINVPVDGDEPAAYKHGKNSQLYKRSFKLNLSAEHISITLTQLKEECTVLSLTLGIEMLIMPLKLQGVPL
jgi:enoyl-[acyl-carrier-protein] reductase (NADH)